MRWHGFAFRWFVVFMFLAFLAVLVVGAVLLWRRGTGASGTTVPRVDEAVTTIRMRYAKGEMTQQEFLEANEALGGPPPTPPLPPPTPPA